MEEQLKCQDCGKEDETVKETLCPFDEEIHEQETRITVCSRCYRERALAI